MLWSERFTLEPLGDQAVLGTFASEQAAARFALATRQAGQPWLVDVVLAYATVAVFFDQDQITFDDASAYLRQLRLPRVPPAGRLHTIPCCYERPNDLGRVSELLHLATEEIIRLHQSVEYTVFAIGFCPGFPYLGYLPTPLCGVPRLETPRLRVEPGSVGLTGKQTGIYPLPRPGGWHLIGQAPLELVNVEDGYFPLRTGDRVKFQRVDETEYRRLQGQRLPAE